MQVGEDSGVGNWESATASGVGPDWIIGDCGARSLGAGVRRRTAANAMIVGNTVPRLRRARLLIKQGAGVERGRVRGQALGVRRDMILNPYLRV